MLNTGPGEFEVIGLFTINEAVWDQSDAVSAHV